MLGGVRDPLALGRMGACAGGKGMRAAAGGRRAHITGAGQLGFTVAADLYGCEAMLGGPAPTVAQRGAGGGRARAWGAPW